MDPLSLGTVLAGAAVAGQMASGGAPPRPETVPVDPDTQKLIDAQMGAINEPKDKYSNDINVGIDKSMGLLEAGRSPFDTSPNTSAIKNRYRQILGKEVSRIKNANVRDSYQHRYNQLQKIQAVLAAKNGLQAEAYQRLADARANEEAARSQFLSSIGSLAGTFGGYAIGRSSSSSSPSTQKKSTSNSGEF